MAGFAGILTHGGEAPDEAILDRMEVALALRGKSSARYVTGGFAMIRISNDLEASPPFSDDGGALIEIDGALEPGEALALYRHQGPGFGANLEAPFSFMLYDASERSVILGRDRFGTHPVYYAETDIGLAFASEISALLASGLFPSRMDRGACEELVQLQFTCGRRTTVQGVSRVRPGESLVAIKGKRVDRQRRDMLGARRASPYSEEDALMEFEKLFHKSVERSLEGCSSVSLIYGGEIEGTVLMSAVRVLFDGQINVYVPHLTNEPGMKALDRARVNAAQLNLDVTSVPVSEETFWNDLPGLVKALDDPVVDYIGCYLYQAAEAAANDGGRVLLASGADEMFAGRSRYRSVLRPLWLGGKAMRARGFMEDLGLLYDEGATWRDGIASVQSWLASENLTVLQRAQGLDAADFLANDVLALHDRVLSHHGLDGVYPYLDERVAEYGFWLEDRFKIAHGLGKSVLRQYLAKRFPIIDWNKRYRWPSVPVRKWISHKAHDLGNLVAFTPGVTAISPPDAVENLFLQLQDQPAKRTGNAAWQLLFFALWYKIHIEGRSSEGSVFEILAG
jgi:asparagine synthase (glutamine-hydrolysing)